MKITEKKIHELFYKYFRNSKKQTDKAREIAKHIYQTLYLKEQHEEHEITTIQELIQ